MDLYLSFICLQQHDILFKVDQNLEQSFLKDLHSLPDLQGDGVWNKLGN